VVNLLDDDAFDATDVVDIGYDALADFTAERADKSGVAGGNFKKLTWALALVVEHAAAEQAELNALKAPPVYLYRVSWRFLNVQCRHGNPD
jgi:hypothetical protein